MPKCCQCDRPSVHGYKTETGGLLPLCIEHSLQYQQITDMQMARLEREQNYLSDSMDDTWGLPRSGPRYPPRPQPVQKSSTTLNNVKVESGATVGVINAGGTIGSIDLAISSIANHDRQLAAAIQQFTEAVANGVGVPSGQKAELLEIIDLVATEATQPKETRRKFAVGPLLTRLAELATVAEGIRQAWTSFGPTITAAF